MKMRITLLCENLVGRLVCWKCPGSLNRKNLKHEIPAYRQAKYETTSKFLNTNGQNSFRILVI